MELSEYSDIKNDPLIGTTVAGRFKIVERVGTGGMGAVYRAEQIGLRRSVALKVLKKFFVDDEETVARFHREAKAMSLLMHANTVRVFDFGQDAGSLYLAMELLEGQLLTAWMESENGPTVQEALRAGQEILRSLAEAHSKGIIHRDLKPDNIFLAQVEGHARAVVKVLDFGIAKVFRDDQKIDQLETQAGTVFGTPRYMSPEQAQGKTLDHRSDLYTVAVLLYHMLVGRPPFVDDDAVVVMAKHIREHPTPVRDAAPARPIPKSLERVIERGLAKDPEDRFSSAEAFEKALGAVERDVIAEVDRRDRELMGGGTRRSLMIPLAVGAGIVSIATVASIVLVTTSGPEAVAEAPVPTAHTPSASPASTPETEATPSLTDVILRSQPPGARVTIDGRELGQTPLSFELGPEEELEVTLSAAGHRPQDVVLTASEPARLITLPQRPRSQSQTNVEPPAPTRTLPASTTELASPPPRVAEPPTTSDPYERFD